MTPRLLPISVAALLLFACVVRVADATEPNIVYFQTDGVSFSYTLPAGHCRVSAAEPRHAWLFAEMAKIAVVYVAFIRCDEMAPDAHPSGYGFLSTPNAVKGETVPAGALDFRTKFAVRGTRPPDGSIDADDFAAAIQQASTGKPLEQFGPISLEETLASFGRVSLISGQARMGIGVMAVIASRPFAQYLITPLTTREDLERQNTVSIDAIKTVRRANP